MCVHSLSMQMHPKLQLPFSQNRESNEGNSISKVINVFSTRSFCLSYNQFSPFMFFFVQMKKKPFHWIQFTEMLCLCSKACICPRLQSQLMLYSYVNLVNLDQKWRILKENNLEWFSFILYSILITFVYTLVDVLEQLCTQWTVCKLERKRTTQYDRWVQSWIPPQKSLLFQSPWISKDCQRRYETWFNLIQRNPSNQIPLWIAVQNLSTRNLPPTLIH